MKLGWLTPLDGLPPKYDIDDLVPTVRSGLTQDGRLFALPFYAESSMTYYRKDLFSKAGLTMPSHPSYREIMELASKIHNPGAGVYGICLRGKPGWGESMAFLTTMVHSFGGRWFNEHWHPELDNAIWAQTVSFYIDLLTRYGPPNADRNGFNENLALFSEGRCGIWIDATVAAGMLFDPKRSKVAVHLGYAPAPTATPSKPGGWLWSWALAIPSSSKNKKEALQFISWATSKDYILRVANNYGWVAVPPGTRKSTYANGDYAKAAPFAQFVLDAIESANMKIPSVLPTPYMGIGYVGISEFPAMGNQVALEIEKALRKEQTTYDALGKSQTFTEELMKRSGYFK